MNRKKRLQIKLGLLLLLFAILCAGGALAFRYSGYGVSRSEKGAVKDFVKSRPLAKGETKTFSGVEKYELTNVSGSISLDAPSKNALSVENISGSIRVQLENVPGYEMHYATVSGDIKDTYMDTRYSENGSCTYGDASLKLELSSVSGSIKLTDWE